MGSSQPQKPDKPISTIFRGGSKQGGERWAGKGWEEKKKKKRKKKRISEERTKLVVSTVPAAEENSVVTSSVEQLSLFINR
jgi:hypothetical protein